MMTMSSFDSMESFQSLCVTLVSSYKVTSRGFRNMLCSENQDCSHWGWKLVAFIWDSDPLATRLSYPFIHYNGDEMGYVT